jgi:branched-chain amino acid aminotransferase
MLSDLTIRHPDTSRLSQVDFDNLAFGAVFSDHMFSMVWEDGAWRQPEIVPYGPISIDPSNATLHYGQAIFEGLKAFRGVDGAVRVFRPDMNYRRLVASCERLCVPVPPEEVFHGAIERLVSVDSAWIPRGRGQALYVRPIIFSDEGHLEVRPSRRFRFLVMTAPVRAYFDGDMAAVSLKVEETYTRSAPGGTGAAKTAGNYAGSLYPGQLAQDEGCAQVLWLDGIEHRYVEEVGAMNIFFRVGEAVITPELRGTILPGVTRDSVITLLRERGERIEERRIAIDEIAEGIRAGTVIEAFGAGTAAIIAPVGRIAYRGEVLEINANAAGPLTRSLYEEITGIQTGEQADTHRWNRLVPAAAAEAAE